MTDDEFWDEFYRRVWLMTPEQLSKLWRVPFLLMIHKWDKEWMKTRQLQPAGKKI